MNKLLRLVVLASVVAGLFAFNAATPADAAARTLRLTLAPVAPDANILAGQLEGVDPSLAFVTVTVTLPDGLSRSINVDASTNWYFSFGVLPDGWIGISITEHPIPMPLFAGNEWDYRYFHGFYYAYPFDDLAWGRFPGHSFPVGYGWGRYPFGYYAYANWLWNHHQVPCYWMHEPLYRTPSYTYYAPFGQPTYYYEPVHQPVAFGTIYQPQYLASSGPVATAVPVVNVVQNNTVVYQTLNIQQPVVANTQSVVANTQQQQVVTNSQPVVSTKIAAGAPAPPANAVQTNDPAALQIKRGGQPAAATQPAAAVTQPAAPATTQPAAVQAATTQPAPLPAKPAETQRAGRSIGKPADTQAPPANQVAPPANTNAPARNLPATTANYVAPPANPANATQPAPNNAVQLPANANQAAPVTKQAAPPAGNANTAPRSLSLPPSPTNNGATQVQTAPNNHAPARQLSNPTTVNTAPAQVTSPAPAPKQVAPANNGNAGGNGNGVVRSQAVVGNTKPAAPAQATNPAPAPKPAANPVPTPTNQLKRR